jgi:membrane protein implicated in regulation of membrane protease activity
VDWVTALFLVGGILLIASEALHTALVPVFLGVAALIVAALRGLGIVETVPMSLLVWSFTSVALALPLRPLAKKFVGGAVKRFDRSDEVRDAYGEIVEIVEAVDDVSNNGRIRFQGTTWAARSTEGTLAAGTKAKLFAKDNRVWVVEPLTLLDEDRRVPTHDETAEVAVETETRAKGK